MSAPSILNYAQTMYFGLAQESQSLRSLRSDTAARCLYIWTAFFSLYFLKDLVGSDDPRVIAFHGVIPWIAVAIGLLFMATDRFLFREYREKIEAGKRYEENWRKEYPSHEGLFTLSFVETSAFGLTTIQLKLLVGVLVWGYVLGNQYYQLHAILRVAFGRLSVLLGF